jgi:AraC-like DNA-binding protein
LPKADASGALHLKSRAIAGLEDIGFVRQRRVQKGEARTHVHGRDRFEIGYMVAGHRTFAVNGRVDEMVGGDVLLVRPNDKHEIGSGGVQRQFLFFLVLRLDAPSLLNLAPSAIRRLKRLLLGTVRRKFRASPGFHEHFVEAVKTVKRAETDPAAALLAQSHLLALVTDVVLSAGRDDRRTATAPVTRAVREIRAHPERYTRFPEVARLAGLPPATLRRRFLKEVGEPVMDFVQRCRTEVAKERFRAQPGATVTRVALDLGFQSSQHFATVFRRYAGLAPREFRRASARGLGPAVSAWRARRSSSRPRPGR